MSMCGMRRKKHLAIYTFDISSLTLSSNILVFCRNVQSRQFILATGLQLVTYADTQLSSRVWEHCLTTGTQWCQKHLWMHVCVSVCSSNFVGKFKTFSHALVFGRIFFIVWLDLLSLALMVGGWTHHCKSCSTQGAHFLLGSAGSLLPVSFCPNVIPFKGSLISSIFLRCLWPPWKPPLPQNGWADGALAQAFIGWMAVSVFLLP